MFLKQPPTEGGVGGRLDGGETLARRSSSLSREHYGLVGLVASGTKESSSHPSGLFCSEENAHERSDRNFSDLSSSIRGSFQTFSRDKNLDKLGVEKKKKSLDANKSPGSPKSARAAVQLTSITAAFSQCFAVFVQFGPSAGIVQDLDRSPLLEPVNVRRCWCFTEDCQNTDRLKPPRFPGSTI